MARNIIRSLAVFLLVFIAAQGAAQAQVYLFDFGATVTVTATNATAGNDPVNTWNNVTDTIGGSLTGNIQDLKASDGTASLVDFTMVSPFNGANTNGTTASTLYPSNATRDSLYGNTEAFNGRANFFPAFKLSSLDPALTYDLTFYASRTGVVDNRETLYTVTGFGTNTAVLNAANNIDGSVSIFGVSPSLLGEIQVNLTAGANNNNTNHFTYLGAMRVATIPEPASAALLAGGLALVNLRRRRRS